MPIVRNAIVRTLILTHSLSQANKLTTVKKCLNEVLKYGGAFSPRDLYPVRVIVFFRFVPAVVIWPHS